MILCTFKILCTKKESPAIKYRKPLISSNLLQSFSNIFLSIIEFIGILYHCSKYLYSIDKIIAFLKDISFIPHINNILK
jgi:hypothetical protein